MERAIHIKHCVHCGKPTSGKTSKTKYCGGACRVAVYRLNKSGFTKYGVLAYPTKDHNQTMKDLLKDDKYEYLTFKRERTLRTSQKDMSEIIIYKRTLK